MNKYLLYISVCIACVSCDFLGTKDSRKGERVIARVNDVKLYENDLRYLFPQNISKEDSVLIARDLIYTWAKHQLLLVKSELNLPEKNEALETLVKKYREDLFINSFKEALVKQELDTVVSEDEIITYYEKNKESFKTNEELIKFKYIQFDYGSLNKKTLRRLFLSRRKSDLQLLANEEEQFNDSFLSDSIWVRYNDLLNKAPQFKTFGRKKIVKPATFLETVENDNLYYLYVKEVLPKNEIAPIRFVKDIIKDMVIHKRKLELMNTIEKVLLDDATKNKQFEIY